VSSLDPVTKKRPRTERRIVERDLRRAVRVRERIADLERGGSADYPIEVPSAAVIDGRARSTPCIQCGGDYDLIDHEREEGLRKVSVKCRQCGAPRTFWFRIVETGPN